MVLSMDGVESTCYHKPEQWYATTLDHQIGVVGHEHASHIVTA